MGQTLTGSQTALMQMYRDEVIMGYERGVSPLKDRVTTDFMNKGGVYTFLIADTGSATATTRGLNGHIPARVNNNNQVNLTLEELHDLVKMTDFNIFTSQGPQRFIMQQGVLKVIGRTIDDRIFTQLDACTNGVAAAAQTDAYGLLMSALTILGNNNVDTTDGQITATVSRAFFTNLQKVKEFNNFEYMNSKSFEEGQPNAKMMVSWNGIQIIVHNGTPGTGTAAEKCFLFHRNAIGFALDQSTLSPEMGVNDEQNYSWARCSGFFGAKLLQNSGCVEMLHDGSGYAPATGI